MCEKEREGEKESTHVRGREGVCERERGRERARARDLKGCSLLMCVRESTQVRRRVRVCLGERGRSEGEHAREIERECVGDRVCEWERK